MELRLLAIREKNANVHNDVDALLVSAYILLMTDATLYHANGTENLIVYDFYFSSSSKKITKYARL